ncbi:MAG TPA: tetratricopeptide repeat protein, partial [Verrucomicrobiae bacterium]|nr:tetratricopeptide repeat protein [Verrucomicrobiae bacterium]
MATVRFSPDGTRIVTASADNTARIWDSATGRPLTEPIRHDDEVTSAVFSPDGRRVVTASVDRTARIWDAETGRPLTEPWQHEGPVLTAEFSPDGASVVTASTDGTARLWESRPTPVPVPSWFLDWSEARIGRALATGVAGKGIPFAEQQRRREALAGRADQDYFTRIARWLESDPASRSIAPFGTTATEDFRKRLLEENNIDRLREAILLEPADGEAWLRLAALLRQQPGGGENSDQLAEAGWSVQTGLHHQPDDAEAWRLLGNIQWHEDQTAAALLSLERALTLEPGHAEAWGWKARMLEQEQDLAGALDAYRRGLALMSATQGTASRQHGRMQVELSVVLRRLGQADDAAAMLAEAQRTLGIPARDPGAPAGLLDLSP